MSPEQDPPASSRSSESASSGTGGGSSTAQGKKGGSGGGGGSGRGGLFRRKKQGSANMLPGRERRTLGVERFLVRVVATCGIVGIGVAIAAIMVSSKSQGWLIGLVVSVVTVVLSAILWSSRQL